MTTHIEHTLDEHLKTCDNSAPVISLTITRQGDGLEIRVDTHLHGSDEIGAVCEALTDVRSELALAGARGLIEQAQAAGDTGGAAVMAMALLVAMGGDPDGE